MLSQVVGFILLILISLSISLAVFGGFVYVAALIWKSVV